MGLDLAGLLNRSLDLASFAGGKSMKNFAAETTFFVKRGLNIFAARMPANNSPESSNSDKVMSPS
jgi:hypothetical protein